VAKAVLAVVARALLIRASLVRHEGPAVRLQQLPRLRTCWERENRHTSKVYMQRQLDVLRIIV
jgi:hypothetical protein